MLNDLPSICIEATGLGIARGYRVLFSNLGLTVGPGEIVELRGPNGSGKSTLLRILAGLTTPQAGTLTFTGEPEDNFRHFLGHLDAVKPNETARQQAVFWARYFGKSLEVGDSALARVGLTGRADVPGRGLSAGQKRRLALTRLIIDPRPIWLLDEPLAALDVNGIMLVRDLVAAHVSAGGLVVTAVHGDGFSGARSLELSMFEASA